jgi:beta-glucanase (GH16 family)
MSAPGANWKVAWSDEFNGHGIDSHKWSIGLPWTGDDGTSRHFDSTFASYITDNDVAVSGGMLHLLTRKENVSDPSGTMFHYTEGLITSAYKFSMTSGYVEIRAQIPTDKGLWPAFWMLGNNGWPPEDDVAEWVTSGNRFHQGLAYGSGPGDVHWNDLNTYKPLASGFHTYGMEWGPGYQIFTVDDHITHTVKASYVPSQPMYFLLNSGVEAAHLPDASTAFPNSFDVDYVRVYRKDGTPAVSNPGFEGGAVGLWNSTGNASVVPSNAHSGSYALQTQGAGSSVQQLITGLKPKTSYVLTGYASVGDIAEAASIGVKNFGGVETSAVVNSLTYAPANVSFTTGRSTTATIYGAQSAGSGFAWFDDFSVRQVVPLKMSAPGNRVIRANRMSALISFTLKGVAAGTLPTLSATSSKPTLLPVDHIAITGGNGRYAMTLTPASDQFGTAAITITASDDSGRKVSSSFHVRVTPTHGHPRSLGR